METEQTQELWQVEAAGKRFETTFAEMTSWIAEGSLLKIDRVRKGNLRWIEAGKVPSLLAVFNAKDNGQPLPPAVTITKLGPSTIPGDRSANSANFAPVTVTRSDSAPADQMMHLGPVCTVHADAPASFICKTCASQFCKACPNSYGGTVKLCPLCGALCDSLAQVEETRKQAGVRVSANGESFGFGDFGRSLAYPFKFRTSLIMGALMFMFFSFGQAAVSFGGIFMLSGAITCFMCANTLTFGILANIAENFSQGKIGLNFMPTFEDFSLWDDVVHPFFLSIGVYIASFGPLIAIGLVVIFMIVSPVSKEMNGLQSDAARTVNPELPYASRAAQQSEQIKELLKKDADDQKRRIEMMHDRENSVSEQVKSVEEGREVPPTQTNTAAVVKPEDTEESVERANEMIRQNQKAQLEAAVGKTPETAAQERASLIKQILGYGPLLLILGGVCLLWGLFYFPAACAVAGYTRSFTATLNPSVGVDTIRRLGGDYIKILLMGLALVLVSLFVSSMLSSFLSDFDLPGLGNVPARAIGSLFGFYFSVVFSCVIGFALYKAADRLKLYG